MTNVKPVSDGVSVESVRFCLRIPRMYVLRTRESIRCEFGTVVQLYDQSLEDSLTNILYVTGVLSLHPPLFYSASLLAASILWSIHSFTSCLSVL